MEFGAAVKAFFGSYFDFSGRSSRSEYWWPQLFIFIVLTVMLLVAPMLGETIGGIILVVIGLFCLGIIIPTISVGVRRLHDTDKSGWFMLLSLIPLVSLVLLVFFCMEGTKGQNRFGPDPLSRDVADFN